MAKKSKSLAATSVPSAPSAEQTDKPRHLKKPNYASFKLHKRIAGKKMPGFFTLFRQMLTMLHRNWKVFVGLTLVYGLLNAALVQGFGSNNLTEVKAALDSVFTGNLDNLAMGTGLFLYLLGASGNTLNASAAAYQLILGILFSVVFIWVLRQVYAGHKVGVRDGLYRGATPLVPFVLVLLVVVAQLLPLGIGASVYGVVISNGLAVTGVEYLLWAVLFFITTVFSLYMIASSAFALYIVTLPDMRPMAALRSARELVRNRRFAVLRRIVLLPLVLIVLAGILTIPLILFATPLAPVAFFALSMCLLPTVHAYMYTLYRSLL